MTVPNLPGIRHPIAGNLLCTPEYYRVLSQVAEFVRLQQDQIGTGSESIAGLQNQITALYGTLGPLISASGAGIVTRHGKQFGFVDPADSDNVTLSLDYGTDTLVADLTDLTDTGSGSLLAITRDAKGRITGTRGATITGTSGEIDVANGNASAGLPTISLADVTDSGTGAFLAITRDAKGRVSGSVARSFPDGTGFSWTNRDAAAGDPTLALAANLQGWAGIDPVTFNTDLLPEGSSNLYSTPARTLAAFPTDYIAGLQMIWVSASALSLGTGEAYIPSLGTVLSVTSTIAKTGLSSLTANTAYHVYLYSNAGTPDIEITTTAPAAAYQGSARTKTGDTSRRYVGSICTGAAGIIKRFKQSGNQIVYLLQTNSVNRPLANGVSTSVTTFTLAPWVPSTCVFASLNLQNLDTTQGCRIGTPDLTTGYLFPLNPGSQVQFNIPPDASQQMNYQYASAPPASGLFVDVMGYTFGR